jgi:hypothetical protein
LKTLSQIGSPEMKKIIAFEGAFEKLFTIMNDETMVVVKDCMEVVYNLLYDNEPNQVCKFAVF